jgi:hypothetical protein
MRSQKDEFTSFAFVVLCAIFSTSPTQAQGPGPSGLGLPIFVASLPPPPGEPVYMPRLSYAPSFYRVQNALKGLGYYYNGAINGISATPTQVAIYNLLWGNELAPGSSIDGQLLEALR